MDWAGFCLGKAEECELWALQMSDAELRREWRLMAADWRAAAKANDDQSGQDEERFR